MSRRVRVKTVEMGFVELLLIYENNGVWEDEWAPLQAATELVAHLPRLSKEAVEQAFIGWSKPLVNGLGPPPKGVLLVIPKVTRECFLRRRCPFYMKGDCLSTAKKKPYCFEPDGFEDEAQRRLASECVKHWHEGVYVVVVQET